MQGQVYKVHTDSYSVKCENIIYKCKARGVLKIKSEGISVGDYVRFNVDAIEKVLPRKNHFIRPNVANIDLIVAVVSPEPKPDFYLLDKLYLNSIKENVEFIIVTNKTDISSNLYEEIKSEYGNLGVNILSVSAENGQGIDKLKELLTGKLTVLAGQSAAGKTSIINKMFDLSLRVGALSDKILRGKHTTTRSEIFECDGIRIIDSPGFAVIDAMVSLGELPECYPEYFEYSSMCKFRGCSHITEPDCKVKEMVDKGVLSINRYNRYKEIYDEISKRRVVYEKN